MASTTTNPGGGDDSKKYQQQPLLQNQGRNLGMNTSLASIQLQAAMSSMQAKMQSGGGRDEGKHYSKAPTTSSSISSAPLGFLPLKRNRKSSVEDSLSSSSLSGDLLPTNLTERARKDEIERRAAWIVAQEALKRKAAIYDDLKAGRAVVGGNVLASSSSSSSGLSAVEAAAVVHDHGGEQKDEMEATFNIDFNAQRQMSTFAAANRPGVNEDTLHSTLEDALPAVKYARSFPRDNDVSLDGDDGGGRDQAEAPTGEVKEISRLWMVKLREQLMKEAMMHVDEADRKARARLLLASAAPAAAPTTKHEAASLTLPSSSVSDQSSEDSSGHKAEKPSMLLPWIRSLTAEEREDLGVIIDANEGVAAARTRREVELASRREAFEDRKLRVQARGRTKTTQALFNGRGIAGT